MSALLCAAGGALAVPTTGWTEDPANPVYSPGKAYYPSIVKDGGTYEMWSTKSGGIQYATSSDGTTWTTSPSSVTGLTNPHHVLVKRFSAFGGSNSGDNPSAAAMTYRMWYWDTGQLYSINAIRYAESPDGLSWYNDQAVTQVGTTVVGADQGWRRGSYGPSDVLYNPAGSATIVTPTDEASVWANRFVMYYDGTTGGDEATGLAVSNDGITWQGYNGGAAPVFAGAGSGWDDDYATRCTVIKENDDAYHMWYSGGTGEMNAGIGYAFSTDGINWVRDAGNPIFHKTDGVAWRSDRTYTPVVIGDEMWLTGKSGAGTYAVGHATAEPCAPIPEPVTVLGVFAGAVGLAGYVRRRRT
jgi:hypothetical protein